MRIENRQRRRIPQACGFAVVVFAAGLLAVSMARAARGRDQSPPGPVAFPAKGMTVRIGGNIMEKQIEHQVSPVCPVDAKAVCASGTVVLRAVIALDGSIERLDVISGSPLLLPAALDAVKQWRYRPTELNRVAVKVDTTIKVSFDAPGANAAQDTAKPQTQSDPWTVSETVAPADLEKELSDSDPAKRPIVACVGFKFLYDGGHVPGASYHGPAAKPEGLADLKAWAQSLPKFSNVVIYCGCCPMVRCPNLRPAFTALHDAGFARLRVLLLPMNFATDWAGKGYPIEKGKP